MLQVALGTLYILPGHEVALAIEQLVAKHEAKTKRTHYVARD